jgi:hypothetical protein
MERASAVTVLYPAAEESLRALLEHVGVHLFRTNKRTAPLGAEKKAFWAMVQPVILQVVEVYLLGTA